jgi:hypothetical protein
MEVTQGGGLSPHQDQKEGSGGRDGQGGGERILLCHLFHVTCFYHYVTCFMSLVSITAVRSHYYNRLLTLPCTDFNKWDSMLI